MRKSALMTADRRAAKSGGWAALALLPLLVLACGAISLGPARAAESNTDRPGNDYARIVMEPNIAGYAPCESRCVADRKCRAWTFVKSGVQGPKAVCYLKNDIPKAVRNTCCVSDFLKRGLMRWNPSF